MIDIKRLEWDREYWDEVAPEGANRYYDRPHYQCFLKHSSLDQLYHLSSGEWHPIPGYAIQSHLNSSFPRPEPRQAECDGSGLPPVGSKVEVWINNVGYWATVTVLAVDVDTVVWRNGSDRTSYIGTHIDDVRPVRTKKHREREELTEILQNGRLTLMSDQLADLILRSGWSKNDG